jgi:ring-1,2-phenylacetyl-CoA epoxidase subunit PaaD
VRGVPHRARRGVVNRPAYDHAMISRDRILDVLATIPDPEMPISIIDLGLVESVHIDASNAVQIDMLPTFIGCPALDMIAGDVRAKVSALSNVESVKVNWLFDPLWSVDRITEAGRASLREHGVTVPAPGSGNHLHVAGHDAPQTVTLRTSAVPCPFCGSNSTYLDSPFGPTRCRTIYYCESCKNSFEHLKKLEPRMNTDTHG